MTHTLGPHGLIPDDPKAARAAKPRGSLADAVRARQECVPCRGPAPPGAISLRGYVVSWSGYGQIVSWLGKGLDRNGVPFRFLDEFQDQHNFLPIDSWVSSRVVSAPAPGGWVLQSAVPHTRPRDGHPTVNAESVRQLNRTRGVIVPCRWNADGFRESGVTVPIRVVPLGVATEEGYVPRPWPAGKPFTFGMAGRMAHGGIRKGLNEGMAAFVRAFDRGEDVRLEVKVYPDCVPKLSVPDDPRIEVITRPMTPPEMAGWCGGLDCLFVPSKSEGWGLHTIQAMAVGRPVIAANYGGTAEFWTPECGWPLPYREEPAREFYGGVGNWAVPTEAGMVDALRAAFRDPDGCRVKGAAAAERAAEFPWSNTGRGLVAALKEFGAVP